MELNNDNYYSNEANWKFMSYSQFKQFCECPAKAMAMLKGEWKEEESESMLIGSYIDSWLDGNIEQFRNEHPSIFNSRTGELKAGFKQAEQIIDRMSKDKMFIDLLTGERQKILTCNIAGVPFKAKIDSFLDKYTVDGKVLKDCKDIWIDGECKPFFWANRYDIQAAIYKTARRQNMLGDVPFRLAVVTKENEPDLRIFEFSNETIDNALQEIIAKAPIFQEMKDGKTEAFRCGCCNYCKNSKILNEDSVEIL